LNISGNSSVIPGNFLNFADRVKMNKCSKESGRKGISYVQ